MKQFFFVNSWMYYFSNIKFTWYIKFLVDILHLIVLIAWNLSCKFIQKAMQVYMLRLIFLWFYTWTKKQGFLYFAGIKFCDCFSWKLLACSTFWKFLREVVKVAKFLKAVEIKIFNLSFWKKKSYRKIKNMKISAVFQISMYLSSRSYGVTTVSCYYRFHTDRSNNSRKGNIITDDENNLAHLRCFDVNMQRSNCSENSIIFFSTFVPKLCFLVFLIFIIKPWFLLM